MLSRAGRTKVVTRTLGGVKRFSSSSSPSPSPQQKPTLPGFWESYWGYSHRTWTRLGELLRYRREGVFPPSHWMLQNYNLYLDLQLPSYTDIDAVEFLNGATFACEQILRGLHSQKMINYATKGKPSKKIPKPDVAKEIEAMLSTACYEKQFLPHVRRLAAGLDRVALTEFELTGAHLTKASCSFETLDSKKFKERMRDMAGKAAVDIHNKRPAGSPFKRPSIRELSSAFDSIKNSMVEMVEDPEFQRSEDNSTLFEEIRLITQFNTTHRIEAVTAKTSERIVVERDVQTTLTFESLVPKSGHVDWRVVHMMIANLKQERIK